MYVSDITGKSYTGPDFLAMVEKRVRKHIRMHELVSTGKTYRLFETSSLAAAFLMYILKHVFEDRITISKTEGVLLLTDTLDEWVSTRVDKLCTNTKLEPTLHATPLQVLSAHELIVAAKLLNLYGDAPRPTHHLVQELHQLYPQTKSSFLKSFLHIEKLLEESTKEK